jgi:hypothetical protein
LPASNNSSSWQFSPPDLSMMMNYLRNPDKEKDHNLYILRLGSWHTINIHS